MRNELIVSKVPSDKLVVELSSIEKDLRAPKENQVVVQVRAAPINPSDLALLVTGGSDLSTCTETATGCTIQLRGDSWHAALKARHNLTMPVGNEAAGVVVAAGSSSAAQQLLGKPVYLMSGKTYCRFRTVELNQVVPLGGSVPKRLPDLDQYFIDRCSFINPLTVLGFVHTMRKQGHTGLVHTAAASQLGRILIRVCRKENIPLVNIVRRQAQVDDLKNNEGADFVVDSSSPNFRHELVDALVQTGSTCAFDATGGGKLAGQILAGMESAINKRNKNQYSRYGSDVHKQCYLYGSLDMRPTVFNRGFGMNWSMGGWLLTPFLTNLPQSERQQLFEYVVTDLNTNSSLFSTTFSNRVSLESAVKPNSVKAYSAQASGTKYVITPFMNAEIQLIPEPSRL